MHVQAFVVIGMCNRDVNELHTVGTRKPIVRIFANNKGADQPSHSCGLTSAFFLRLLESIISKLAPRENFTILASLCS